MAAQEGGFELPAGAAPGLAAQSGDDGLDGDFGTQQPVSEPAGTQAAQGGDVAYEPVDGGSAADDAPAESGLVSAFTAAGFEIPEGMTDEQLAEELQEMSQLREVIPSSDVLSQLQQQAVHGRRYLEHATAFERWRQEQAAAQQQGAAAATQPQAPQPAGQQEQQAPAKPKWEAAPTWNPEWDRVLERDEQTGRLVPIKSLSHVPGLAEEAAKANQVLQRRNEIALRLASDPYAVVREAGLADDLTKLREELRQEILGEIKQQQVVRTAETEAEQYLQSHMAELFELDAAGQAKRYVATNDPVLTDKGRAYQQALIDAESRYGITDEFKQHAYARDLAEKLFPPQSAEQTAGQPGGAVANPATGAVQQGAAAQAAPQPPQQPVAPQARNASQKTRFIRRARQSNRLPNRDATVVAAEENGDPQNDGLSFSEMAMQELRKRGLVPATG